MELRYRRIIYTIFIVTFAVAAPAIIFYTAGYRYSFKKNQVEKTGILFVESVPREADIYINGRHRGTTPKRFTRMLPDRYELRVEKDGYHSWQKSVAVQSNLTTFHRDIVLFADTLPISVISGDINIFTVNAGRDKMVYSIISDDTEELRLFNLRNQVNLPIASYASSEYDSLELVQWSPDHVHLLINKKIGEFNYYEIINTDTLEVRELFDTTRTNFENLKWDSLNPNHLYGTANSVLWQVNLIDNSATPILAGTIVDFQSYNGDLYYIKKVGSETLLINKNTETADEEDAPKIKLPSADYTIEHSPRNLVVLLNNRTEELFVISAAWFTQEADNVDPQAILQSGANRITWNPQLDSMLFYSGFEISLFNARDNTNYLITRYGSEIKKAEWYPAGNYIFFLTDNRVRVIESKNYDMKFDLALTQLSDIDDFAINYDGSELYVVGSVGNQDGIYRQQLR